MDVQGVLYVLVVAVLVVRCFLVSVGVVNVVKVLSLSLSLGKILCGLLYYTSILVTVFGNQKYREKLIDTILLLE